MSVDRGIGCFGAALVYADDAKRCKVCVHKGDCRSAVAETLDDLAGDKRTAKAAARVKKGSLGIKYAVTLSDDAPAAAKRIIGALSKRGIDPIRELADGKNPFAKPVHLGIVTDLLLERPRSRRDLVNMVYQIQRSKVQTAETRVSEAISVLSAIDAIERRGKEIKLRGYE